MESLPHSWLAFAWLILGLIVPVMAIYLIHKTKTVGASKVSTKSFVLLLGLQLGLCGTGFLLLETGEIEEEKVEGIVEKKIIQNHESSSEIANGLAVLGTILTVVVLFVAPGMRLKILIGIVAFGLLSSGTGLWSRSTGESIIKARKSEPLYDKKSSETLDKAPGTFSDTPTVNESLNRDENDYEGVEEDSQVEDDDKQED